MNMDDVEEADKTKKIFYLSNTLPSVHSSLDSGPTNFEKPLIDPVEENSYHIPSNISSVKSSLGAYPSKKSSNIISTNQKSSLSTPNNTRGKANVNFPNHGMDSSTFINVAPAEASAFFKEHGIWEFRKVLSYWSIIFYMIGCFLFTMGSIAGFQSLQNVERVDRDSEKRAFVTFPYVLGSSSFFLGGYISYFRVLNSTPDRLKLVQSGDVSWFRSKRFIGFGPFNTAYIRSVFYLAGGFFYTVQNWNKFIRGSIENNLEYKLEVLLFLSVGSILQQIGSFVDLKSVNAFTEFRPNDLGWWSVWLNALGCLCYQIGSHVGWVTSNLYWTNLPYVIGSIVFLIASWFYLLVWKQEQWMYYHSVTKGYVSIAQQVMTFIYIFSLTLSVTVVVFAIARHSVEDLHYGMFGVCGVWLNVGLLQLSNSLTKVPQQKVQRVMLYWLRVGLLLFTLSILVVAGQIYNPCFISCS